MKNLIVITVLLLVINCKVSSAVVLNCTFGNSTYSSVGSIYGCTATFSLNQQTTDIVEDVFGDHEDGMDHDDVEAIIINHQNMEFMPTNIEAFFPNIILIDVWNNSISNVSNRHFNPFPNLVHLRLTRNIITSLDTNILAGLNSITYVSFAINTIRHIGHDFILPSTGEIFFQQNFCIDVDAETPEEIDALRFWLLVNCPPTITQIEDNLLRRSFLLSNVNGQIAGLINRMNSLEQSHTETIGRVENNLNLITNVSNQVQILISRTNNLELSHSEMRNELGRLSDFVSIIDNRVQALEYQVAQLELRAKAFELRATILELRASALELRATSFELRAALLEIRTITLEKRVDYLESNSENKLEFKGED